MRKETLFSPFPKQMAFIEAIFSGKYRYILYGGGIRSGKTFAGLGALILLCKYYPNSRWAIVRDALPTIKRNTIPSFNKICPQNFIKSYNQDTQTVTFTNGSQILFFSENYDDDKELNRWRGLEVNGFLLEEANELQYVSFLKAIERAGSHVLPSGFEKPKPLILLTVNPSWGWVKEVFYDRYKSGTLPNDYLYIPALITDNPIITADTDYMASLENLPRLQYEIFVKGNWDINLNEHPWLYALNEDIHVVPVDFLPQHPIYVTFDINADPLSCTVWQISPNKGTPGCFLHCINEFGGHIKVDDICSQIKTTYPNSIIYVTGDRSGQNQDVGRNQTVYQIIQSLLKLSDKQMNLNTHNLEHADSRLLCNTIFQHYPIRIHPRCVNLITDCRKAAVDMDSSRPSVLKKDRGAFKMDYFDGMRYLFQTYFNDYIRSTYLNVITPPRTTYIKPPPPPKQVHKFDPNNTNSHNLVSLTK